MISQKLSYYRSVLQRRRTEARTIKKQLNGSVPVQLQNEITNLVGIVEILEGKNDGGFPDLIMDKDELMAMYARIINNHYQFSELKKNNWQSF